MNSREDTFKKLRQAGQQHLVDHYNSIKDQKLQTQFLGQIEAVDLTLINNLFKNYKNDKAEVNADPKYDAISDIMSLQDIEAQHKQLEQIGLDAIRRGQVAVVLMSGGQGTRLGFDHPKGMFKIGLQSDMSLFEFFSKRLERLNQLAKTAVPIAWYIMTSEMNDQEIQDYFAANNFFGYAAKSVRFFPQGGFPAVDFEGKIIIQSQGKLSLAPQGNGAIYYELSRHKMIGDMKARNVKYVNFGAIDNILLKLADPLALGYMIKNNRDIVSKFTLKKSWDQNVGCHCLCDGKPKIMEYSEMSEELKKTPDSEGRLKYRQSFMAIYFMTVDMLYDITHDPETMAKLSQKYHFAQKKVTALDKSTGESLKPTKNTGVKFQLFCFDCFDLSKAFGLFQVDREKQYAPLKNAVGDASPETAKLSISNLHFNWLKSAELKFKDEPNGTDKLCQVNTTLSYNGEGLEDRIKEIPDQPVALPFYLKPTA